MCANSATSVRLVPLTSQTGQVQPIHRLSDRLVPLTGQVQSEQK
jgi:hypothetical protein